MKSFWKRGALWVIPFVALSVAIWRVQEARSWLPRVSPSGRTPNSSPLAPLPMSWREDGLWMLAYPHDLSYPANNLKGPPPFVWKKVPNWNQERVLVRAATLFADSQAALARDSLFLVRGRGDANLELWRSGRQLRVIREKPVPNAFNLQKPGNVDVMALSPNGSRLAASSQLYGLFDIEQIAKGFSPLGIVLWDAATGRQIARQNAIEGAFTALEFSDDGTALAGATCDGYIFILDAKTGQKRLAWRAHRWLASALAWSPDGKLLVTGANPRMRYTFQWKSGTGMSGGGGNYGTIGGGRTFGTSSVGGIIKTDQNGTTIKGESDRDLKLWDAQTGKLRHKWQSATGITSLDWSPDGKQIAVGTHGEALLFDAQSWKITRRFPLPKDKLSPATLAFHPDGHTLAVTSPTELLFWRVR